MRSRIGRGILVAAALVLAGLAGLAVWGRGSDMRNDFTTTPSDPPRFEAIAALPENAGRDLDYPYSRNETPALGPLAVPGPEPDARAVLARVRQAAQSMAGWRIVAVDPERLRIEAVATTPLLRFKDDIVIEIRATAAASEPAAVAPLQVHMRSKSRLGRSDFGANRKRVALFFERLEADFTD